MGLQPFLERRQILAPVERAVHEVLVTLGGTTGEGTEIGQVMGMDLHRRCRLPAQQTGDAEPENHPGPPRIRPSAHQRPAEGAGENVEHRIRGQDVPVTDVEVAGQREPPVNPKQRPQGRDPVKVPAQPRAGG